MADLLREALGVDVEVRPGARGEFSVCVGADVVARKTMSGFPTDEACVEAVRAAL